MLVNIDIRRYRRYDFSRGSRPHLRPTAAPGDCRTTSAANRSAARPGGAGVRVRYRCRLRREPAHHLAPSARPARSRLGHRRAARHVDLVLDQARCGGSFSGDRQRARAFWRATPAAPATEGSTTQRLSGPRQRSISQPPAPGYRLGNRPLCPPPVGPAASSSAWSSWRVPPSLNLYSS